MKRDSLVLVAIAVAIPLAVVAGVVGWGAGHYTNRVRTVGTLSTTGATASVTPNVAAVADATPVAIPQGQGDAVAGAALYVRDGCINCHGPNGLGGVPNPLSPDKTIPSLSGVDFRKEFNTDKKITDVIRSGSVIGRAPIV